MNKISLTQLNNNAFIGSLAFEIISLRDVSRFKEGKLEAAVANRMVFVELAGALHHFSSGQDVSAELLLVTQPAIAQVYAAQTHLYLIVRKYGTNRADILASLDLMTGSIESSLGAGLYTYQTVDQQDPDFLNRLRGIDTSCIRSLMKRSYIRQGISPTALYCYADTLMPDDSQNYEKLMDALSRYPGACVSIHLIASCYTPEEKTWLLLMAQQTETLARGFTDTRQSIPYDPMAAIAAAFHRRALALDDKPIFIYGLFIMGDLAACGDLASKLQSALRSSQQEEESAELDISNVSGIVTDYARDYPFFPWNAIDHSIRQLASVMVPYQMAACARLPLMVGALEASTFFRLPIGSGNLAGLESSFIVQNKEKLMNAAPGTNGIVLGSLAGLGEKRTPLVVPFKNLTRHALIVGMPGTGKTTFSIHLLQQLNAQGIPFLAIEPTKTEYRAMLDIIPTLRVFTPGKNAVIPFIINPFVPPAGISLELFTPSLVNAFKAAFSMPSPLDILFLKAVNSCYMDHGWRSYSKAGDPDVRIFGIREFVLSFQYLIRQSAYSNEVKGNLEGAGVFRLMNLVEQNGNIYDTINTMDMEDLLKHPTVIELNAIDNQEQKALLMALLLINMILYTKHKQLGDGQLKNALLIDEAHVLLNPGTAPSGEAADTAGTTVRALQNMIVEIRSFGTAIIIADQSPSKVTEEIVSNTDVKVVFRLIGPQDKALIAGSSDMNEADAQSLSKLKLGEAYVYFEGLSSPRVIQTTNIRETLGIKLVLPDTELSERVDYWCSRKSLLRPYHECAKASTCQEDCDFRVRDDAKLLAEQLISRLRLSVKEKKNFIYTLAHMDELITKLLPSMDREDKRLMNCVKIKYLKRAELEWPHYDVLEQANRLIIEGLYLNK